MFGYFAKEYARQPTIAEAMVELGPAINHIHLNDGSRYMPDEESGVPDGERRLPMAGGFQLWYEAYVPGKGELCTTDCIVPWLKAHQADDRTVTLTLEVEGFDGKYAEAPRSRESFEDALEVIYSNVGQ